MFCPQCGVPNDDAARFCHKCGSPLAQQATPPPPDPRMRGTVSAVSVGQRRFATGKNPTVAVILSIFIVGVGQFYNGDVKKGATMLAITLVAGLLTGGLAWLPMVVWSAIDAYNVATGKSPLW